MDLGYKLQMTQPLILYPEEEHMFKTVNTVFHDTEVKQNIQNLNFNLCHNDEIQEVFQPDQPLDNVGQQDQFYQNQQYQDQPLMNQYQNQYNDGLYHPE